MFRSFAIWIAAAIIALTGLSQAHAALVFHADFARDGTYETSWPMIAGEVVTVDIYVSNVPAPGLISMGFKLVYAASNLEALAANSQNWLPDPIDPVDSSAIINDEIGEIEIFGFRLGGLWGDNIRLGSVTFRCKETGTDSLVIEDRAGDWFVLDGDGEVVLDGDIGAGVLLATIRPPVKGDVNGDQNVDLADAVAVLQEMTMIKGNYLHANADCSGDGAIGLQEIIYILREVSDF